MAESCYVERMLTQERLRHCLEYNSETGAFIWLHPNSDRVRLGSPAGTIQRYLQIRLDGRRFLAHRLAWLYMTGGWPPKQIDHINGNKLDNRWNNLRLADPSQNNANCPARARNTSGFKGVTWHKRNRRWQAQIRVRGKPIYLGQFDKIEDAAQAYSRAAEDHFGEFSRI